MLHLRNLSILMLGLGIALVAAGLALDLSEVITLIGLMLVVAGAVKIATVRIWHGFFDSEPGASD